MESSPILLKKEYNKLLKSVPGWKAYHRGGQTLSKRFIFKNFTEAIAFVNKVASLAKEAKHHPDILISYNKVSISTTTHDVSGLTEKDFSLAERIERVILGLP